MALRDSRTEYKSRMHRVVGAIDRQLDQPLDLAMLAEVAHFSAFHFHRLFAAWMGETLGDYLRRRRLEVAAMRLAAQPRTTVLNDALSVGFGSAARAFRKRFASSPTARRVQAAAACGAVRKVGQPQSKRGQIQRKFGQAPAAASAQHQVSRNPLVETAMNVKLIDRQPVTVAYLRHLRSGTAAL